MITDIPLDAIEPSPHNPRRMFDQEKLLELAESIKQCGVLQPIRVMPIAGALSRFRLIAGERRWRASLIAGRGSIPAIITTGSAAQLREIQLDENMQREQLSPLEEAQAFKDLQQECGYSIARLAQRFRRSAECIRDRLALLALSSEVQQALAHEQISLGAALALRSVADLGVQGQLAGRIAAEHLTVEQSKQLVRSYQHEQRQAAVRLKRQERQAYMVRELAKLGPVVTPETYQPGVHHRIWDLHFPACTTCPLKGNFIRPDFQLEDVCVTPACYTDLLKWSEERAMQRLDAQRQERWVAFSRVLQLSDEVLLVHLQYQLWVLLEHLASRNDALRAQMGLPPFDHRSAAREADWQIISSWTYAYALGQIVTLCINFLAALSNDRLPHGLKQSLISSFGLPPHVLGEQTPDAEQKT